MVGPTPRGEYDAALRSLLLGFVLFVGFSSMVAAYYGGGTTLEVALLGGVGVLVAFGALLAMGVRP